MHLDDNFKEISYLFLFLFGAFILIKKLRQPYAVGYILAGLIIGPSVFGLVDNIQVIRAAGAIGIVFLLFFIGMEISPKKLIENWKATFLGTFIQINISIGLVWILGHQLDWPISRIILIGFVITLSSTAMVIQYLQEKGITKTAIGVDVIGVLLAQDIFVVPMLIMAGILGAGTINIKELSLQTFGGIFLVSLIFIAPRFKKYEIKFFESFKNDKEFQVLFCLAFTFGLAFLSGVMELSTALGAFIAGNLITNFRVGGWFHDILEPFRVIFIAIFFADIGLLIDRNVVKENSTTIIILSLVAMLVNTFVKASILRSMGRMWSNAFIAGALLSQVGEFSFIIGAVGYQTKLIDNFSYQLTIQIIALTIILTPFWVNLVQFGISRFSKRKTAFED